MPGEQRPGRDLRNFVLPEIGKLLETGDPWEPYQLLDPFGRPVEPVVVYFKDLMAGPYSPLTPRSYGMDLLRWWRFLWALGIEWDRATSEDARDFMLWMKLGDKPVRVHWRHRGKDPSEIPPPRADRPAPGTPNPVTGKPTVGTKYAPSVRAHCETVLRTFYDWHLANNSGALLVNPFPLDRSRHRGQRRPSGQGERGRQGERANAHHNPMDEFKTERKGRYRPTVPQRIPRRIPADKYTEVFAGLRSHRDRALLAFWVSNGARAEELLSPKQSDAKVGQQTIGVTRKGTGEYQELPANTDAFIWLRLYQEEAWKKGVPRGRAQPLWWTLRRPWRPLEYDAARMMFNRANALLGANWTLHDLRHTATFLMLDDPDMQPVYVQKILGHKYLSTLDIYSRPTKDDVISAGIAHHARQENKRNNPPPALPAPAYNRDSLNVLFGGPSA
ncbi:tyrosine-type recombinase/integrase [Streptomyces sp. A13(2022)]|uniref:tyrosine-type recombinase/integrase n=1 Tax=Streptomyces sp. A13(2022) TaxID=2964768 RepID=UPI0021DA26FA|nr:site-specific integrase [Streptomyces sp. A13(2022)]MCU8595896.1 tyrosine-type recombinase/integrase [Streptomyces sp. A13(2022)]